VALAATLLAAGAGGGGGGSTPTLNWYTSAADGQREQLVRRSAAKDSSLDILGPDVVGEAAFAEAGWVQPWTGQRRRQVEQDAVRAALDTATWKGQLVAAPFNSNTQLLWYRKHRCRGRPPPGRR